METEKPLLVETDAPKSDAKADGCRRNRKEQTAQDFLEQKRQFFSSGPLVQTEDWLFDMAELESLNKDSKIDRTTFLHACENAYYLKNYNKCLALISRGEDLFGLKKNHDEEVKESFNNANRKTKKSAVVDRHIVELLHIKEKCLKKLHAEQY